MDAKTVIENLGGITMVHLRYRIPIGTVGGWSSRGRISANALVQYPRFAKAAKRAGYVWTKK